MTLDNLTKKIRELILDVRNVPIIQVQAEKVTVSELGVQVNGKFKQFSEIPKIYDFIRWLDDLEIQSSYTDLAVITEVTSYLKNTEQKDMVTLKAQRYFSQDSVNKIINSYFVTYCGSNRVSNLYNYVTNPRDEGLSMTNTYCGYVKDEDFEKYISGYNDLDAEKIAYWSAFYLIELQRKQNKEILAYKGVIGGDDVFADTEETITTRVGDTFTVNESRVKDKQTEGISGLWGDRDSFLVKKQLFIRNEFERLFKDFSLRTNSGVSFKIPIVKDYTNSSYVKRELYTEDSENLFQPIEATI